MPDEFGHLVNVLTDEQDAQKVVIPEAPNFVAEAEYVDNVNKQTIKDGNVLIQGALGRLKQDRTAQQNISSEISTVTDNLEQDRWIDFVFGKEMRRFGWCV